MDVDLMRGGLPPGSLTIPRELADEHSFPGPVEPYPKLVSITREDARVLEAILSRDFTSMVTHGGLKGLLTLTDDEVVTFRALVNKITLE